MAKASPRLPDESVNVPRTHRLENARELVITVALLAMVAYAVVAYFVDFAVWALPADADRRLGLSGLDAFAGQRVADHPRQKELQTLVDNLARGWPDRPYDFEVAVLQSDPPNAFAVPGGGVAVTTGLLDDGEGKQPATEMELAFVLGHELGHFKGRDHLRGLGRGVLLSLLMAAVGTGGGDATLVGGATELGALRFSRGQEMAADEFGLGLVHAHYGHVAGTFAFFERSIADDGIGERMPNFASTHPTSQKRIDSLKEVARRRGWSAKRP